jgi:peptidoglycan/LPS O-acetylase OafA/YrhL
VRAGHTGVDLFFLLSGFLLSLPFLTDAGGGRRVTVGSFFARRALRILPLYWLAVVVGTMATATTARDLLHGLPYLVFLDALPSLAFPMNPWGAAWWSLATEAQFYVLLPALLLARSRAGRAALGIVFAAYVAFYVALVRGHIVMGSIAAQLALHNSVLGRGPLFLWGIGAAIVWRRWGAALRARAAATRWLHAGGSDVLMLGVLLAMAAFLRWLVNIGPARQQSIVAQPWHVVNGALWAAVLLLLLLAPLRAKGVLSNRALARLGVLSYSIYLIHAPLVVLSLAAVRHAFPGTFEGWSPPTAAVLAGVLLVGLGLSSLTYRFVEMPFLVRKARFDS